VTELGDKPLPKIIDFGVAMATTARLTEKTVYTEFRQMIGTPEYMSLEQAGQSADDVDTRTDVYAVGILLYELLTGATPFDSRRLRSAAYGEIQRIIREEDPPRPSTRISDKPETLATVVQLRSTPPTKLSGVIQGELDWIVMKAMEKDRARRYDSAGSMGRDIQRYLAGKAVQAAPPGRAYLVRKFAREQRLLPHSPGHRSRNHGHVQHRRWNLRPRRGHDRGQRKHPLVPPPSFGSAPSVNVSDLWYRYTPTASGNGSFTAHALEHQDVPVLSVHSGRNALGLACARGNLGTYGATLTVPVTIGSPVLIRVAASSAAPTSTPTARSRSRTSSTF
jgi:serine/threonine protein kinase